MTDATGGLNVATASCTIDAQVHVVDPSTPRASAHRYPGLLEGLTVEQLLTEMDRAGVDGALLTPLSRGPIDFAISAAAAHPGRLGLVLPIEATDPGAPDRIRAGIDSVQPIVAIRVFLRGGPAGEVASSDSAARIWSLAAALKLPVMVYAPGEYQVIGNVARQHPDLRLAIDHFGLGVEDRDHALHAAVAQLSRLASIDNLAVKATGLPAHVTERYPFPSLRQGLSRVVDAFGAHRVFWGSDLTRLRCSYEDAVGFVRDDPGLAPRSRAEILGDAAGRWLQWKPNAGPPPIDRNRPVAGHVPSERSCHE